MNYLKLIKKWINMLSGNSYFHVKQDIGKCYSKYEIKGYYNDLTNKVSEKANLDENGIPINVTISNLKTYFPITIFQYALGLYDLYILEKDDESLKKFINVANWAVINQKENGMWDCMGMLNDKAHETQSSMCQSEGVSVLLRAYVSTKNESFFNAAKKAIDFMIMDIEQGGTCLYENEDIIFQEYVSKYNLSVLNGWIFSVFGLYDYVLVTKDEKYKEVLTKTIETLCKNINKYDRKFWSNYDLRGTIASPAYHDLHIRQLQLLYDLFEKQELLSIAQKWTKYQNSRIKQGLAMIIKLKQKIVKNKYYDINTNLIK